MESIAGWYGKLPSLGDFATRRLPPDFVEPWDEWLAGGLAAWREADDAWLQAYLSAAPWCFVLGPQVLPSRRGLGSVAPAWAGVLMPSVDRVGRYFPLTLAGPLDAPERLDPCRLARWLRALCSLGVDALHGDWTPDELDEALLDLSEATRPLPMPEDPPSALRPALDHLERHRDHALWWPPSADVGRALQHSRGLPGGEGFARLFGGKPPTVPGG